MNTASTSEKLSPMPRKREFRSTVFFVTVIQSRPPKKNSKFSNPTNLLPNSPVDSL